MGGLRVANVGKTETWANLEAALEAFDAGRFAECFPSGREQPLEQERPALDELFSLGNASSWPATHPRLPGREEQ
jgi:hypothetical protein